MKSRKLIQDQLDNMIAQYSDLQKAALPPSGWIYSIRQGINMSLRQLGQRLSITSQSVKEIEEREKNGTISIKVMRQVANALDMDFVYGFIPKDKTLKGMVERRARDLATQIVQRTSKYMELEDQRNTDERIAKAIKEKAEELSRELPRYLWD